MGVLCSTNKKQIAQNTDEELFGDFHVTDRKGTWRDLLDATYYFIVHLIGSTRFGHYYDHNQEFATIMLITTLVVSFCKDGGGSVNVKLWFIVVYHNDAVSNKHQIGETCFMEELGAPGSESFASQVLVCG